MTSAADVQNQVISDYITFLKAMGLQHVGKTLLLMRSSISERRGKGLIGWNDEKQHICHRVQWCEDIVKTMAQC